MSKQFAKAALWLLVAILLCAPTSAWAGYWGDLATRAEGAGSTKECVSIIEKSIEDYEGSHLGNALQELRAEQGEATESRKKVITILRLMDSAESFSVKAEAGKKSPSALAASILNRPEFKPKEQAKNSNWLSEVFQGLSDWLKNLFKANEPERSSSSLNMPNLPDWLGGVLMFFRGVLVVITILALAAAIFFAWKFARAHSRTLLDDVEEVRTRSEYLDLAEQLVQSGDLRQAIRALYVASLLRLDELKIARFDRSDTNWEHLARFESSTRRPEGLDFRAVTKNFDRFWYGRAAVRIEDVEAFRQVHDYLAQMEVPK